MSPPAAQGASGLLRRARAPRRDSRIAHALAPALVLALAACDAPTVPARHLEDVYRFALLTQPPLVYRWPAGTTIHVLLNTGAPPQADTLEAAFADAAAAWHSAALYGEFRLVRVGRVEEADVVVTWSDVPPPVQTQECEPELSPGVTTFCLGDDPETDETECSLERRRDRLCPFPLQPPAQPSASRVRFLLTIRSDQATQPGQTRLILAHELGHTLGIGQHSDDPADLMWGGRIESAVPSDRDRTTLRVLYQTPPDIVP